MGAFHSFSISHPLALNLCGLIQNSVSSGLTSALQGGPMAPVPSEVILTVQPFPVASSVTAFAQHLLGEKEPTAIHAYG